MEPRIQYAKTKDGVSIAFWTLGEGTPLIHMPLNISHIQMEWEFPECRDWYERLAKDRLLVRYDHRGQGLSDREGPNLDFSLEALVAELEALVDRLGLERLALLGLGTTGPAAIAFAARYPERVSHLILCGTYAKASDWALSPQVKASRALVEEDWTTYTETMANTVVGWSQGQPARRFAELVRAAMEPDTLRAAIRASLDWDVSDLLPSVRSPTLVIHRRQLPVGVHVARRLSSGIPDARLALLDGDSLAPYLGDTEAVLRAIDDFLATGEEAKAKAPEAAATGLVTILFTDMESSTALTQSLGDAKAQELVRVHNTIVRDSLKTHVGSEIKHTGDGIMASFATASAALECAISIQRAVAEQEETRLRVRIGLNAGEPVAEEDDLFGASVQLARRICDHADPGQIVAANVVRELSTGKGFLFSDLGDVVPKGFDDAVRLYEVRWRE